MNKFTHPHIAIDINNIEDSKKFYTAIGFIIVEEDYSAEKKRQVILFEGYNFQIEAFHFDDQEKSQSPREDYKKVGFLHFAIPVKDLNVKKKELLQKEIKIEVDIRRTSLGVLHLTLLDPSGITVEFFQEEQNL